MLDWLLGLGATPKLTPKHLQVLIDQLLAQPPDSGESVFPLRERELKRLCSSAREVLLKDPSLVEIRTSGHVVVVGDLHGQFQDLQRIFERLGRPGSDDKTWVFLGDYIDRGPMGLEIVSTLLALKLLHPDQVYMLRGNHECSEISVLFGFCGECQRRSTLAVWEVMMQVFDALPLAALLNVKVFLCHGGISPYLRSPQDINTIRRPLDVNPNGEGLMCDLLWADPSAHISGWCANPRGVSFVFGLDVAQAWMRLNGLRAIVRAHMVQQTGFEVLGNNEIMTVFSATDYRESGNTGAVLVIAASLDFEFVTFVPPRLLLCGKDQLGVDQLAADDQGGDKFGSPPPPQYMPLLPSDGVGAYLPAPVACSPFAAVAGGPEGTAVLQGDGQTKSPAAQAMMEEVAEEQLVIDRVGSDRNLSDLVRHPSEGLFELNKLTGGSRVPAEALARTSSGVTVGLGHTSPRT